MDVCPWEIASILLEKKNVVVSCPDIYCCFRIFENKLFKNFDVFVPESIKVLENFFIVTTNVIEFIKNLFPGPYVVILHVNREYKNIFGEKFKISIPCNLIKNVVKLSGNLLMFEVGKSIEKRINNSVVFNSGILKRGHLRVFDLTNGSVKIKTF